MKTNVGLVEYCKAQLGRPYWFGTFGQIATEKLLEEKASQYKKNFSEKRKETAKKYHLGQKVHDCYGLPKGYLMSESADAPAVYDSRFDISADAAFDKATEKGEIDTLPEIAGIGLWKKGHFGVYIGGGKEIEARGFDYGVVEDDVKNTKFTHWFKIADIEYGAESPSDNGDVQIQHEDAPVCSSDGSSVKTYVVKKNDNLSKIGAKFGISVKDLVEWNKIENPNLIYEGQELVIKSKEAEPPKESFTGKVTTNSLPLNIRRGSDIKSPVIGSLKKGELVEIAYETGGWGKLFGREGFVSMKFITKV